MLLSPEFPEFLLGLTAADANFPGRVPLRTKCRIFVGRHGLREPSVLNAAKCKIPVQRRDSENSTCPSKDHAAHFGVFWKFWHVYQGHVAPATDGPWQLRLVDAVTREVTPTSAAGEHASALQHPARMWSLEKKPLKENRGVGGIFWYCWKIRNSRPWTWVRPSV